MPLATGAGRDLYFIEETTFGTTPSTPVFNTMRTTGGALNLRKNNRVSNEVRKDRQIPDLIYGAERVEGELAFEFSHGSFDDLLAMALMSDWSSDVLKVGTDLRSMTIEEFHSDIGQYLRSTGCTINTMNLSITTDEVTGSFGILGKGQTSATTAITGSTYTAPSTTTIIDGFVGSFELGGSSSGIITQVDLALANGHEVRNALGGALIEHKHGRSNLTGTISMYFEDMSEYTKFINGGASSVQCDLTDGTNTTSFLIPRLKYTEPDRPVDGETDIVISMPFQALYDVTKQSNIVITRA